MTETDRKILAALRLPWLAQLRLADEWGWTSARWARRALAVIHDPEAERVDPQTVRRWRRIMAQRRDARRLQLQRK